ncbi:MAG: hypothetical protein IPK83_21830 [Planctomycetes bacterium]|nr:hypothetical protein [Planctomycetota bacterium]
MLQKPGYSTPQEPPPRLHPLDYEPRWKMWGCLVLMLVGLHLVIGPKIQLSIWEVQRGLNSAFDEALQWRHGTMALSDANPRWEAPIIDGKAYNVVGPLFVLISIAGTFLSEKLGTEPGTFFGPLFVLMVAVPLPLVAFGVFRSLTRFSAWGAVMAAYLIAGTSLRPMLTAARHGTIYQIDHLLACTGLLLLAGDLLGKRRIWPAVIGLAMAVWSRQMTCFYALPLLWIAAWSPSPREPRGPVNPLASIEPQPRVSP